MYYPYLRGKQNELMLVREQAGLLAQVGFVPIIEPVKENLSSLRRALDSVVEANGEAVVIINPAYGDHAADNTAVEEILNEHYSDHESVCVGISLPENILANEVLDICDRMEGWSISLVHNGYSNARELADGLGDRVSQMRQVFLEDHCGRLYRRHFRSDQPRILLRDGFERRKNAAHPEVEFFSDLHITYVEEGVEGFGDFLIVGDEYSETGGPAYAVAIHLTFIDPTKDNEMHMHHFISDSVDTPTNPAGKFSEALRKLVAEVEREGTPIQRTNAVIEFLDLHERQHFPGLGYAKKLSMQHHVETLALFEY